MSEVSGIYSLAPPGEYVSPEESEDRLRRSVRRLVQQRGLADVVDTIRKSNLGTEIQRSWLVLTAYAEDRRR